MKKIKQIIDKSQLKAFQMKFFSSILNNKNKLKTSVVCTIKEIADKRDNNEMV